MNGEGRLLFMSWSDNRMLDGDKSASSRKCELRDFLSPEERRMQRERDFLGGKEHSLIIEWLGLGGTMKLHTHM